jgi:hypothetical protein
VRRVEEGRRGEKRGEGRRGEKRGEGLTAGRLG